MRIIKINDKFALADMAYETHKRGKNYAALIIGLDEKFGLRRIFLNKANSADSKIYIFPEKPTIGQIIEVRATYFSGSGNPTEQKAPAFSASQRMALHRSRKMKYYLRFKKSKQ